MLASFAVLVCIVSSTWQQTAMALSPPAYLPQMNVRSLFVSTRPQSPSFGTVQLLPSGCPSGCTGYQISNEPGLSTRTNSAAFTASTQTFQIDAFGPSVEREVAAVQLSNGGFMIPMDAGATSVTFTLSLSVSARGTASPVAVTVPFEVHWSGGSPSPVNNAGLFVLVKSRSGNTPPPTKQFELTVGPGSIRRMQVELLGFVAHADKGKDVTILGDWGQQPPAAGRPGPRAYIKEGAPAQTVKLIARVSSLL